MIIPDIKQLFSNFLSIPFKPKAFLTFFDNLSNVTKNSVFFMFSHLHAKKIER